MEYSNIDDDDSREYYEKILGKEAFDEIASTKLFCEKNINVDNMVNMSWNILIYILTNEDSCTEEEIKENIEGLFVSFGISFVHRYKEVISSTFQDLENIERTINGYIKDD